ncbi:MAG: virulence RhuM family protein [Desulfomicrobium sp.]|nr:virulence RhuM family protein [Pseudomonadota bacterium]MBV1713819.1 virulence RhuM family protein [Desulfomicrobium sp.]MBU4572354.1 virulence RhuM family protein [Pseudomonadota bacterium]MBU4594334.1 virulence RhuM family protein [Pseudomonadota bacterium]MBV1719501.1 virulence RhuM family protein [Desulfomicrobium sp.]
MRTVGDLFNNIFISGELERTATVPKMETVQREGGRSANRRIEYFNLDAVISVGYRVKTVRATRFRQWATRPCASTDPGLHPEPVAPRGRMRS